jgi:hypothetical protein
MSLSVIAIERKWRFHLKFLYLYFCTSHLAKISYNEVAASILTRFHFFGCRHVQN